MVKLILFIVVMLCLVGPVQGTISYHSEYDRIEINGAGEVNITLADLNNHATVGVYVKDMGSGLWYLNKTLWLRNGASICFNSSEVTELRSSVGTASKWLAADSGTTMYLNNFTWKSWNNNTDIQDLAWKDTEFSNISDDNIRDMIFDGFGHYMFKNVQDNTEFSNISFLNNTGNGSANYAIQFTGATGTTLDNNDAYDVVFDDIIGSGFGIEVRNMDGVTISNVTITDDFDADYASVIKVVRVHNFTIKDIVDDNTNNGVVMHGSTDGTVDDVNVEGDYPGSINGEGLKFYFEGDDVCNNITATNVTVKNSGYGGLSVKGHSQYIWITDCSADNGSHNGLDVRADYVYVENTHIENFNDSNGQNYHLSVVNHSTVKNCSADGKGFYLNTGENNTIENFIHYNMSGTTYRPIGFGNEHSSKIINYSFVDYTSTNAYTMELFSLATGYFDPIWSNNNSVIDVDWSGLAPSYDIRIVGGPYNNYINVNATTTLYNAECNTTWWWYPNITVKNSAGNPIEGATLTFESNNSINSVNAYGDELLTTTTTATGKMPTPTSNRTGCIALAEKFDDYASDTFYSWNITADKDNYNSNTTIGYTFDGTCYTSNLDEFNGGEIVIILSDGFPALNHIYFQRPFMVDENEDITQLGTPVESDIDLTTLTQVKVS